MADGIDTGRDPALVAALEDFHRRRGRGETPSVDDYREQLGDSHAEFRALVEAEAIFDAAMSPPRAEPLPRVFGAYTLVKELGRGGSGVVYEAFSRSLKRKVALKILRSDWDTSPNALARFRREAEECAQVRHGNIVAIYEAGGVEGRPFYAMDLVPGETLAALVKAKRRPPPRELARGLAGIADALQALHESPDEIVHRDVKPSNVMVRPDGAMVLCDFGLARGAESPVITKTGDMVGTPMYMSPEQVLSKKREVDPRTDVYGLGATFYEGLTGHPLFENVDEAELYAAILTLRPLAPRAHAPDLPPAAEKIALKCLEKAPTDRYASARDLAVDLRALAEGRDDDVTGTPVSPATRFLRKVRKRWIPIAAYIVVAAAGAYLWTHRDATFVLFGSRVPPDAIVSLNGEGQWKGGDEIRVAPGTYTVKVSREHFLSNEFPYTVAAGERALVPCALPPDPEDPEADRIYFEATGVHLPKFRPAEPRGRSGGPPLARIQLYFPRGDVRIADLDAFAVQLDVDVYEKPGVVEFRRGGDLLARVDTFEPSNRNTWSTIPQAVRDAVHVGDEVTWGWFPAEGHPHPNENPPVTTTFRVVDTDPSAGLARLDKAIPDGANCNHLKEVLRASVLRDQRLQAAAFREAYRVLKDDPDNPYAISLVLGALDDWGDKTSIFRGQVAIHIEKHGGAAPSLERAIPAGK